MMDFPLPDLIDIPVIENEKDGTLLVLIPEGEFLTGDPKFPVRLPGFYLAMHPVTNGQYARYVKDTGGHREWKPEKWGKDDHPAVNVNWDDAKAYCEWAGLRLPTELEWEKGARYVDGRKYPWGEGFDGKKCHSSVGGSHGSAGGTCGVWKHGEGSVGWGAYQMSGNVWEWCEDMHEPGAYDRYRKGDLRLPGGSGPRVVRGGSWYNYFDGYFRGAYRAHFQAGYRGSYQGLRCART